MVPGSQVKAGTAMFDAWSTLRLHVTAAGGARKPQALKAFASWLRLKSGCLLEGAVLAQHQLTQAALQASAFAAAGLAILLSLWQLPLLHRRRRDGFSAGPDWLPL